MTGISLRSRILVGFLLLASLLLGTAVYQLRLVHGLADTNRELAGQHIAASTAALDFKSQLLEHRDVLRRIAVIPDAEYVDGALTQRNELRVSLDRLAVLANEAEVVDEMRALQRNWERFEATTGDYTELLAPGVSAERLQEILPIVSALVDGTDSVVERLDSVVDRKIVDNQERVRRATHAVWISSAVATSLALILGLAISRSAVQPLRELAHGTEQIARGNFEHRILTPGPAEIARVTDDFNLMAGRLQELDQLKSEFITGVSHDLKSPLASMRDTLALVLDGSLGPVTPKQQRMLELTLSSLQGLSKMIANLLDLARIESGLDLLQHSEVGARDLLHQALLPLRPTADKKALQIRWHHSDEAADLQITGDEALLERALGNVIDNAIAHSPRGAELHLGIEVDAEGDDVLLCVEDSGPGIPEEERERIFEKFHRTQNQRSGPRGSGLGLTLTRNIVLAHDGLVWVEQSRTGGSRFVVRLPRALRAGEARDAGEVSEHAEATNPGRIVFESSSDSR